MMRSGRPSRDQLTVELKASQAGVAALQGTVERMREALERIVQWAEAYPIDIFHEPTKEECRDAATLLRLHGMTLDAFSASMGRHCLKGVKEIAKAGLGH